MLGCRFYEIRLENGDQSPWKLRLPERALVSRPASWHLDDDALVGAQHDRRA